METDNKDGEEPGKHVLFNTPSNGDFHDWSVQNAERSRRKMSALEERMDRIEQLKAIFSTGRGRASNGDVERKHQKAHACMSLPGQCQHTAVTTIQDVEDVQDFSNGNQTDLRGTVTPGHRRPKSYCRDAPFTPNMSGLRTIIHDEVAKTVTGLITPEVLLRQLQQLPVQKSLQSTEERPRPHLKNAAEDEPGTSSAMASDASTENTSKFPQHTSSRPCSSEWTVEIGVPEDALMRPRAWTANTGDSESAADNRCMTPKKMVLVPRKLKDTEPMSCTLLNGGLSRANPFRILCFSIWNSKTCNTFFFATTMVACFWSVLITEIPYLQSPDRKGAMIAVQHSFAAVFALEVLISIIALGFIKGPKSYLQISAMHRLDLFLLIIVVGERITVILDVDFFKVQALRILRILPILTRFRTFSGIRTIVTTLVGNAVQMATVLFLIFLFLLAFSTLMLILLGNSFSRRCVATEQKFGACAADFSTDWVPSPTCDFKHWKQTLPAEPLQKKLDQDFPIIVDDFYPFERWCQVATNTTVGQYDNNSNWDLDFKGRYHSCGRDRPNYKKGSEMCVQVGNPSSENGFVHFDSTGSSLFALLQSTSQDGYSDIIWKSIESEPDGSIALILLWVLFGLIATWLLLGIFVAVVTAAFSQVLKQHSLEDEEQLQHDARDLEFKYNANLSKSKVMYTDAVSRIRNFDEGIEVIHEETQAENQEMVIENLSDMEQVISHHARIFVKHKNYSHFKSIVICGHAFAMASDQYDNNSNWNTAVKLCHIIFNSIFALDLVVHMCAVEGSGQTSKIESFLSHQGNIFEVPMVSVGILGLLSNIKVFLLIPVFRIYFLLQYLPTLQNLLEMAIGSAKLLSSVLIFIFVTTLAISVICRDIFGDRMDSVPWNFSSFPEAMITTFQIFTGDGWSYVLFDAMKAQADGNKSQALPAFLIISWFIFSGVVINNLLVAVVVEAFEVSSTIENVKKPGHLAALREKVGYAWKSFSEIFRKPKRTFVTVSGLKELVAFQAGGGSSPQKRQSKKRPSHLLKVVAWATSLKSEGSNTEERKPEELEHRVLLCIPNNAWIRKSAMRLGESTIFEGIVLAAILTSCFFLLILPPGGLSFKEIRRIDPTFPVLVSDEKLKEIDYLFTILFTVECSVRILDRGLFFTKRAYLKDPWNVVDFFLVISSLMDMICDILNFEALQGGKIGKVLRLARALRPLRVMKRNPSMRELIGTLFGTLRPVAYVILFQMVTLFNFALIGLGIFGGKYQHCRTTEHGDQEVEYPGGKRECMGFFVRSDGVMFQRSWDNPNFHFDTLAQSVKSLFVVQNFPFVEIMHTSMDLTDYDLMHSRNYSQQNSLFFVIYVFVGGILAINLFVAFIVDGFNICKGLTKEDQIYFRFVRLLSMRQPPKKEIALPKNFISCFCRSLVEHFIWQRLSITCVAINVALNLTESVDNPPATVAMLEIQNLVFGCVLLFEVFVNFIAYGPRGYIADKFRAFDLMIGAMTFVGIAQVILGSLGKKEATLDRFAKALRLARIMRLMAKINTVKTIIETAIHCLPALANILVLLVLIYSIFAVFFTQIFGLVKYGERLGNTAHFYSFGWSVFTIYQIVTGDAWELLLSDSSVEWPRCTRMFNEENVPGWTAWRGEPLKMTDCGGQLQAILLYAVLKIVCQQMMLNLFVGMILENFSFLAEKSLENSTQDERWSNGPSEDQIDMTAKIFFLYCRRRRKISLRVSDLRPFLCELPLPIGFRRADGTLTYGVWERAATKLIRAELNVILHYNRLQRNKPNRWNSLRKRITCDTDKDFQADIHEIDYVTLMETSLFWRKPDMVPLATQKLRVERVEEVVRMVYALMIKDALRNAVARAIATKMNKKLESSVQFFKWETFDPARCRQREHWCEEFASEKELAARLKKKTSQLYWPPTETIHLTFDCIQDVPKDMLSHHDAFLTSDESSTAFKSVTVKGLETFLEFSRTHLVVVKDLGTDTENNYFIGNLTQLNFSGWITKNTPQDTFFFSLMRPTSKDLLRQRDSMANYFKQCTAIKTSLIRYKEERIFVKVCRIRNFANTTGFGDRTDPFIKITHGKTVLRTSTANNVGGNATFDEILQFTKSRQSNILLVQIYDGGNIHDDILGEVEIDLTQQICADGLHPEEDIWFDCINRGIIKGTIQLAFAKHLPCSELPPGSLVDIQSCVHDDVDEKKADEEMEDFAHIAENFLEGMTGIDVDGDGSNGDRIGEREILFTSRVRLNIGRLRIDSLQERESLSVPHVLEVLGYVTAEQIARDRARAREPETKKGTLRRGISVIRKLV